MIDDYYDDTSGICEYEACFAEVFNLFWRLQLEEIPGLVERMASLMCVDMNEDTEEIENNVSADSNELSVEQILEAEIVKAKSEGHDSVKWLELEELSIDDTKFLSLDLPGKFPVCTTLCSFYLSLVTFLFA